MGVRAKPNTTHALRHCLKTQRTSTHASDTHARDGTTVHESEQQTTTPQRPQFPQKILKKTRLLRIVDLEDAALRRPSQTVRVVQVAVHLHNNKKTPSLSPPTPRAAVSAASPRRVDPHNFHRNSNRKTRGRPHTKRRLPSPPPRQRNRSVASVVGSRRRVYLSGRPANSSGASAKRLRLSRIPLWKVSRARTTE